VVFRLGVGPILQTFHSNWILHHKTYHKEVCNPEIVVRQTIKHEDKYFGIGQIIWNILSDFEEYENWFLDWCTCWTEVRGQQEVVHV
jgi:hypothetical protein